MRLTTSAMTTALLMGALALAPAAAAQEKAAAPKEHSMTGCLQKGEEGTFKLTDLEKGPPVVEIAETTANLTPHVSHKVEITGTAIPGKDKTHTMKVTAVRHISPSCP